MRFTKSFLSLFLIIVMVMVLFSSMVTAETTEKDYEVNYKDMSVSYTKVQYEKDYDVKVGKAELYYSDLFTLEDVNFLAELNGESIGNMSGEVNKSDLDIIPELSVVFTKGNYTKKFDYTLEVGLNTCTVEYINSSNNKKGIWKFIVTVKEKDDPANPITDPEIIKTYTGWTKIKDPKMWKTSLQYGEKSTKKYINLGETVEYTTDTDIYAIGKAIYRTNNYFSINRKLNLDGTDTKLIAWKWEGNKASFPKFCINGVTYWYKVEFVVNVKEVVEDTGNDTGNNDSQTTDPIDSGIDTLPKTGEMSPIPLIIFGLILFLSGSGFMLRKKILNIINLHK